MVILIETEAYISDFAGDPTMNKHMVSFNPTTIALMEDRVFTYKDEPIDYCRIHLQGAPSINVVLDRKSLCQVLQQLSQQLAARNSIAVPSPLIGR